MLTLHHQFSIVEQRYDDHCAGMGDVFAYCYFAIGQPRTVLTDVQKVAIIHVQAADGCFGEVEGWFGH